MFDLSGAKNLAAKYVLMAAMCGAGLSAIPTAAWGQTPEPYGVAYALVANNASNDPGYDPSVQALAYDGPGDGGTSGQDPGTFWVSVAMSLVNPGNAQRTEGPFTWVPGLYWEWCDPAGKFWDIHSGAIGQPNAGATVTYFIADWWTDIPPGIDWAVFPGGWQSGPGVTTTSDNSNQLNVNPDPDLGAGYYRTDTRIAGYASAGGVNTIYCEDEVKIDYKVIMSP